MKKASIIAKLGAAAMAAVMACSSIAASAATVPNATIDTTRKTSLELYKYDFTTAHRHSPPMSFHLLLKNERTHYFREQISTQCRHQDFLLT